MVDTVYDRYLYKMPTDETLNNRKSFYRLLRRNDLPMKKWLNYVRVLIKICDFPKFFKYLMIDKFMCELSIEDRMRFRCGGPWSWERLEAYIIEQNFDDAQHIERVHQSVLPNLVKTEPVNQNTRYIFMIFIKIRHHLIILHVSMIHTGRKLRLFQRSKY